MTRLDWPGPASDGPALVAAMRGLLADLGAPSGITPALHAGAAVFALDNVPLPRRLHPEGTPADAVFDNRVALAQAAMRGEDIPRDLLARGAALGLTLAELRGVAGRLACLGHDAETQEAVLSPVLTRPLVIEFAAGLHAGIIRPAGPDGWARAANALREHLFSQLGIPLPKLLGSPVEGLAEGTVRLRLNGLATPPRHFDGATAEDLLLGMADDLIGLADLLLTPALSEVLLMRLDKHFPVLTLNVFERFGVAAPVAALRLLLRERVSIHNMRRIFGAWIGAGGVIVADWRRQTVLAGAGAPVCPPVDLSDTAATALTPRHLAGIARIALRDQIMRRLAPDDTLHCARLAPATEDRLRARLTPPTLEEDLLALVTKDGLRVLLAPPDLRTLLAERLRIPFPQLDIVSPLEVTPNNVEVLGEI